MRFFFDFHYMGSLIGVIAEETPAFAVVRQSQGFQVRHYAPRLVSQYAYHPDKGETSEAAFRALARYIGVFNTPENQAQGAPQRVAMTAPVVVGSTAPEKVAMTAPVVISATQAPVVSRGKLSEEETARRGPQVMQFNLPRQYTLDTAPQPTNPRVEVREIPAKFVAAMTFKGWFEQPNIDAHGQQLLHLMAQDGLTSAMEDPNGYYCAGFNPPWTPPMFRTNEVYVDLQPEDWMEKALASAPTA